MPPRVLGTVPETGQGPKSPARIFMRIKSNIERSPTHSKPRVVTAAKRERRAVQRQHDPSIRPQKKAKLNSHGFVTAGQLVLGTGLLSIGSGVALFLAEKMMIGGLTVAAGALLVVGFVVATQLKKERHLRMPMTGIPSKKEDSEGGAARN